MLLKKLLLAALLLLPTPAFAAVAHVSTVSERCDNANSGAPCTEASLTVSGSDTILLVCAIREDTTTAERVVASITHNGDSLTELVNKNEGANDISIWYRIAPDDGTFNIVATPNAAGNCTTFGIISTVYSGAKQSGFPDAQATDSDAANTVISTDITTATADAMIHECYQTSNSAATTWTANSGQTEMIDTLYVGARVGASRELVTTATTYSQSMTTDGSGVLVQVLASIADVTASASAQTAGFFGD